MANSLAFSLFFLLLSATATASSDGDTEVEVEGNVLGEAGSVVITAWFGEPSKTTENLEDSELPLLDDTLLGESSEDGVTKSKILKDGMVVTLTGGKQGLYCSIGEAGTTSCDSKTVGKFETLQVVGSAGNGVGLFAKKRKGVAGPLSVPRSSAILVGDLSQDTVSLRSSQGKYCSDVDKSEPIRCEANQVGQAEKFKVKCLENCPPGLPQQKVTGGAGGGGSDAKTLQKQLAQKTSELDAQETRCTAVDKVNKKLRKALLNSWKAKNKELRKKPQHKASSSQLACTEDNYGYMPPDSNKFIKGAWSRAIAIGYQGNSKRTEQYQVSPPGCDKVCQKTSAGCCKKRVPDASAISALKDATCDIEELKPATISAAKERTMAITQEGDVAGWGLDTGQIISGFPKGMKFIAVSTGTYLSCGIEKGTYAMRCWGRPGLSRHMAPVKGIKFMSVSVGHNALYACGIQKDTYLLKCWGRFPGLVQSTSFVEGSESSHDFTKQYQKTQFSSVSTGRSYMCAVEKKTWKVKCFGAQISCANTEKVQDTKFISVSVSKNQVKDRESEVCQTCGVEKDTNKIKCWSHITDGKVPTWVQRQREGNKTLTDEGLYWVALVTVSARKERVVPGPENRRRRFSRKDFGRKVDKFISVSVGDRYACGVEKDTYEIHCFGGVNATTSTYLRVASPATSKLIGSKFSSVSASPSHVCGIERETNIPRCWGVNTNNQCMVPVKSFKWSSEASCQTSHPTVSGPASCTSCDKKGCNPHFTIVDPKTHTGTCTKRKCPTCKPKSCCGEGHKHYVLNSKNLDGVCVRHSDDCTPICIGEGKQERRVCSKGCNQLLKVLKNKDATTEGDMFDMYTCQADKRIICDPVKSSAKNSKKNSYGLTCRAEATFKARAVCSFSNKLWNLGATCIANHATGEKYPQCSDNALPKTIASIKTNCKAIKKPTVEQNAKCSRLAITY
jgi:hypothetical protein